VRKKPGEINQPVGFYKDIEEVEDAVGLQSFP